MNTFSCALRSPAFAEEHCDPCVADDIEIAFFRRSGGQADDLETGFDGAQGREPSHPSGGLNRRGALGFFIVGRGGSH